MFKIFVVDFVLFWTLFGNIIRNIIRNRNVRNEGGAKGCLKNVKKKRRFDPEGRPLFQFQRSEIVLRAVKKI